MITVAATTRGKSENISFIEIIVTEVLVLIIQCFIVKQIYY